MNFFSKTTGEKQEIPYPRIATESDMQFMPMHVCESQTSFGLKVVKILAKVYELLEPAQKNLFTLKFCWEVCYCCFLPCFTLDGKIE